MLIVMEHESRNPYIAADIYMELRPSFPLDLLVRRPSEIKLRMEIGGRFILDIYREGVVLYDADRPGMD